ncbi:MAG: hypothetical protein H6718_10795 [Polyangiaceae bacterium]|nr:hypothetical protein [Polyangiaceae bacterium]MCB9607196.1 hypothetical protein [Polyangiaceae bacterium]
MTPHGFNKLAAFVYSSALAALVYARSAPPPPPTYPDPIVALPENSAVVLTANLERMRHSELGRQLLDESGGAALPAGDCQTVVGHAARVAVAMPRLEHAEDVGVLGAAFSGGFKAVEIESCVRESLARRGQQLHRERDAEFLRLGAGPDAQGQTGVVALRDDGLLLGAPTSYLPQMVAAANRSAPNVRKSEQHRLLREIVGVNGTLLLSAIWDLPWFPGVRAAALSADFSPSLRVELAVRCDDELRCASIADRLRALEDEPMLKLAGLALPRGSLKVRDLDGLVRGSLDVQVSDARPLLRQALALFKPVAQ